MNERESISDEMNSFSFSSEMIYGTIDNEIIIRPKTI